MQRDVPDLNDTFAEDGKLQQMLLDLDLPEVQIEGIAPEQARLKAEAARQAVELLYREKDAPAWLNDYFMLREKGWPFRQAAYLDFFVPENASTESNGLLFSKILLLYSGVLTTIFLLTGSASSNAKATALLLTVLFKL